MFLRRRIRDLRLKHFVRAANVGQFLDCLLDFMRRCQDELVGPEEYARYVERLERGEDPFASCCQVEEAGGVGETSGSRTLPGNRSRFRYRGKYASGKEPGHLRAHDRQGPSVAEGRSHVARRRTAPYALRAGR